MSDYTIQLVCRGRPVQHAPKELAVLDPLQHSPGRLRDATYREAVVQQHGPAAARGISARKQGRSTDAPKAPVALTPSRDGTGLVVHVPACPRCGRGPWRLRYEVIVTACAALAENLPDAPRVVLDVNLLPA